MRQAYLKLTKIITKYKKTTWSEQLSIHITCIQTNQMKNIVKLNSCNT